MQGLSEHQLLLTLLAVAVILIVGRGAAEAARRLRQPEVLGEILGGFLLGPSILGALWPGLHQTLFLDANVAVALSALSWIGAILLLLIAGLEADLAILREQVRPGALAAAGAILPSLAAGTLFGWGVLGRPVQAGFFLGIVLSVTAVSVAAKILIERESLRRGYAQVILAAGIASEVLAWPLVSVASSLRSGDPVTAGARTSLFALLFIVLMLTVGRRFTFWAMRRVADLTRVTNGQLSLVLVLTFLAAGLTQALGLHSLLGAFIFGVVLGQAPRTTLQLKESVQTLTLGLFAPVFFVLAGMRIDLFKLGNASGVGMVLLLLATATIVKVGLAAAGARLGGLRGWAPWLVGLGVNFKGGSDVVVAILGAELGLLSDQTYTMYAVVAVLTVLFSPPLLTFLEGKEPPSQEERARLNREEARRRAYLSDVERVLVPLVPELLPAPAAGLVEGIARAKQEQGEVFDITELVVGPPGPAKDEHPTEVAQAKDSLSEAGELERVELTQQRVEGKALDAILEASHGHNLLAIGARRPEPGAVRSLGGLRDGILNRVEADVLLVIDDGQPPPPVRRVLVPVNGLEYSMSAADVAGYLARAHDAELVFLTVVHSRLDSLFWHGRDHRDLLEAGYRSLREVRFRVERLEVRCSDRVQLGEDPATEILRELERRPYQLVVLGAVNRGKHRHPHLGRCVQSVLTGARTPTVVLVSHE